MTRTLNICAWFLLTVGLVNAHSQLQPRTSGGDPGYQDTSSLFIALDLSDQQKAPQTNGQSVPEKIEQERELEKEEQSKRVLGVIPRFGVTDRQDAPPLKPRQKFRLFTKSAFDPVIVGIVGIQAGLSQADNSFPEYGQGAGGYGKRFGAAFADEVSAGFFSNFAYPTLLRQDPRYFRLGKGSFKRRFFYSIKQELVCHTDNGGRSFHFSNLLGALSGGSISNLYYPESDRGFGLTMSRAGIAVLYGTAGGLFNEFWPDIHRKLFQRKNKKKVDQPPGDTKGNTKSEKPKNPS